MATSSYRMAHLNKQYDGSGIATASFLLWFTSTNLEERGRQELGAGVELPHVLRSAKTRDRFLAASITVGSCRARTYNLRGKGLTFLPLNHRVSWGGPPS